MSTGQYDGKQWNSGKWNAQTSTNTTLNVEGVAEDFNGTAQYNSFIFGSDLTADAILNRIQYDNMPSRDFLTSPTPRDDGEIINGNFFRNKQITLEATLIGTTPTDLNTKIDNMKKALSVKNGNLDIKVNGVIRRYVANAIETDRIIDRDSFNITFQRFNITFKSVEPYAKDMNYTSYSLVDQTALTLTDDVNNEGTTVTKPIFIFNFSAATALTALNVKSTVTNEEIEVTTAITANDIIRFDSESFEVTKNGTAIDYDGTFIKLETGVNNIEYTITGTSGTYTVTQKFKNQYL